MWYNGIMKKYITLLEWRGYIYLEGNMDTRVLCKKCKSAYEDAGYTVLCIRSQDVYQFCDICGRQGLEYKVKLNGTEKNRARKPDTT